MQASMQAAFLQAKCAEVGPAAVSIGYRTIPKQPQNPAKVLLCQPAGLYTLRGKPYTCVRGRSSLKRFSVKVCE